MSTWPLTEQDKSTLSPNAQLLVQIMEAKDAGDYEKADLLRQNLIIPAEALMALKRAGGAQEIISRNLRTETAEAKYGKDWLNS